MLLYIQILELLMRISHLESPYLGCLQVDELIIPSFVREAQCTHLFIPKIYKHIG